MGRLLLLLIILVSAPSILAQSVTHPRQDQVDTSSIAESAARLRALVVQELKRSGVDPETRHMHLIIGFSTGHFAADPLAARAAHEIALGLIENLLVEGDRVSVYAWEMGVWRHPGSEHSPWVVRSDTGADKLSVRSLFPTTCRKDSVGGHDTERAIVEITRAIQTPTNEVVILLANSASSIASRKEKPVGEDDPRYVAALKQWERIGSGQTAGGSVRLSYVVIRPGGERVTRTIDAVVLLPRHFRAGVLEHGTRSERIGAAAQLPSPMLPGAAQGWLPTAIIIGFALALVYMSYYLYLVHRDSRGLASLVESLKAKIAEDENQHITPQSSTDMQSVLDDLREQRLAAIKEKERWQQAIVQMFEAIENVLERPEVEPATKKTYERVWAIFSRILTPLGFQVIRPSSGDLFDERIHVVESTVEDTTLPNMSVVECARWGYIIGGVIIQPAKVVIAYHLAGSPVESIQE